MLIANKLLLVCFVIKNNNINYCPFCSITFLLLDFKGNMNSLPVMFMSIYIADILLLCITCEHRNYISNKIFVILNTTPKHQSLRTI